MFLVSTLWKNVRERKWGRGGPDTAQMLNNSVTVHTGNNTFVSWEVQLSVFNKFPSPGTSGGIKLFPVSACNVKYSGLTGKFKQNQGKKSPPLLFWCFLFVLSTFVHLKFHVLGRLALTFAGFWAGRVYCLHTLQQPRSLWLQILTWLFCAVPSVSVF